MSKTVKTGLIGATLLVAGSFLFSAGPAFAAQNPVFNIGILDIQQIVTHSTAAREVGKVTEQRFEQLQEKAEVESAALAQEAKALNAEQGSLSATEFQFKEHEFRHKIYVTWRKIHGEVLQVQEASFKAMEEVEKGLDKTISKIAKQKHLTLVVYSDSVAYSVQGIDISQEVWTDLNKFLPKVKVPSPESMPLSPESQQGWMMPHPFMQGGPGFFMHENPGAFLLMSAEFPHSQP